MNPDKLVQAMNWRYATKKFDSSRQIPSETWKALAESLILTPSSYGLQPWKFVVVTNKEIMERLVPYSWNQRQVADCSHLVVFAIRKNVDAAHVDRFIARTAEVRGIEAASIEGYRKMMLGDVVHGPRSLHANEWAARQAYIALGNFMTSAALLQVDTCPLEGIEAAKYDKELGLPERGFATVVACAAGYRAADDKYAAAAKVRFASEQILEYR
ncbi:MAG: hypothetical protein RL095_4040 [Verrucomicrobiota bacterium]|jgi:nitroreductase